MKKTILFILLSTTVGIAIAQSPKREMRAAWTATVYRIDWPKESGATAQKNEMIALLDQLQANNLNAICLQVRPRCDAFYDSAYEPWSSDLGVTRGTYPGYDPLGFTIEEAHKRGIEVHAWINPYRYETAINLWTNTTLKGNYRYSHPTWILEHSNGMVILNPGIPEVRQRIVDVVEDILTKYDVDGILFDDYFYVNGQSTNAMDQAQFDAYNPNKLSRADWRRDNVNQMIRDVYNRIQSLKPYVLFGVSPAGVARGGAKAVGLTESIGSDWQYSGIFSDPCAWLAQGSLDFISPQIYWVINPSSANDYDQLSKWWSYAAKKFGKHFYSSHTLEYERGATEMNKQIACNRKYTENEAPGSIFYNTSLLKLELAGIKTGSFTHKALRPAIDWKSHPAYSDVTGVTQTGTTLSWNAVSGVPGGARYTVYAVPTSVSNPASACSTSQYLLGISYSNNYTLSSSYTTGYNFVVGLLDRYGNEFIPGQTTIPSIPVITFPANLSTVGSNVTVTWNPEPTANGFTVERSDNASFTGATTTNLDARVYQITYTGLTNNATYYVRVRAKYGTSDYTDWSPPVQFTISTTPAVPVIASPANNSIVASSVTVIWGADSRATRGFTAERSDNAGFTGTPTSTNINAGVNQTTYTGLTPGSTHYVRVRANYETSDYTDWSTPIQFTVSTGPVLSLIIGRGANAPNTPLLELPYKINIGEEVYLGIPDGSGGYVSRLACDLTSSETTVATISETGVINGIGNGITTIKAVRRSDNATGTALLTVGSGVGIASPEKDAIIVYATGTGIAVLFNGEATIELFTVSGVLIEKTRAYQTYFRDLDKGIYILRVNGNVMKISPSPLTP